MEQQPQQGRGFFETVWFVTTGMAAMVILWVAGTVLIGAVGGVMWTFLKVGFLGGIKLIEWLLYLGV